MPPSVGPPDLVEPMPVRLHGRHQVPLRIVRQLVLLDRRLDDGLDGWVVQVVDHREEVVLDLVVEPGGEPVGQRVARSRVRGGVDLVLEPVPLGHVLAVLIYMRRRDDVGVHEGADHVAHVHSSERERPSVPVRRQEEEERPVERLGACPAQPVHRVDVRKCGRDVAVLELHLERREQAHQNRAVEVLVAVPPVLRLPHAEPQPRRVLDVVVALGDVGVEVVAGVVQVPPRQRRHATAGVDDAVPPPAPRIRARQRAVVVSVHHREAEELRNHRLRNDGAPAGRKVPPEHPKRCHQRQLNPAVKAAVRVERAAQVVFLEICVDAPLQYIVELALEMKLLSRRLTENTLQADQRVPSERFPHVGRVRRPEQGGCVPPGELQRQIFPAGVLLLHVRRDVVDFALDRDPVVRRSVVCREVIQRIYH
eukprot:SAG31_NODE_590_length_13794_cov_22.123695_7_plen_423_part_00